SPRHYCIGPFQPVMRADAVHRVTEYANNLSFRDEASDAFPRFGGGEISRRYFSHRQLLVVGREMAAIPCHAVQKMAVEKTSLLDLWQARVCHQDLMQPTGPSPRWPNDKK